MKIKFMSILIALSPMTAFAATNCKIQVVLDSSSFYMQEFKDIKDGFTFYHRNYRFLFSHNAVTDESTMTIDDLATKKTYSKTVQIKSFQPLNLDVFENGRAMASVICKTNNWD